MAYTEEQLNEFQEQYDEYRSRISESTQSIWDADEYEATESARLSDDEYAEYLKACEVLDETPEYDDFDAYDEAVADEINEYEGGNEMEDYDENGYDGDDW